MLPSFQTRWRSFSTSTAVFLPERNRSDMYRDFEIKLINNINTLAWVCTDSWAWHLAGILYDVHVLPLLCGEIDAQDATTSIDPPRTLLDLGTCLGQDVRKLIFDGVPVDCVYGADLLAEFVDIGSELFRDEEKLPRTHFVAPADIFDESSQLKEFDQKVDIIHANSIFHLFSWEDQVKAAKRVVRLMRPRTGSLILGSQMAHQDPGEVPTRPGRPSDTMYRHDENSWSRFWELVGRDLGLSFTVRTSLSPYPGRKGIDDTHEGLSRMTFEVWRD